MVTDSEGLSHSRPCRWPLLWPSVPSGADAGSDVAVDGCAKRLSALQPRSVFSPRHTCRSDVCPWRYEGGRFRGETVRTTKTQRGLRESRPGAAGRAGRRRPTTRPTAAPWPVRAGEQERQRGAGEKEREAAGEKREGPLTCDRRTRNPLRSLRKRQHWTCSPARVRALMRAKANLAWLRCRV